MDKAITTVLLTIAGVMSVMVILNALYPALNRSTSAVTAAATTASERIKSQPSIIHAVGELDDSGNWVDTNSDGNFDIFIWVKNVGDSRILAIEKTDVFFGAQGDFQHYSYTDDAAGLPYWTYELENGTEWGPSTTLKINLNFATALSAGIYLDKVVIPIGVSDEHFSVCRCYGNRDRIAPRHGCHADGNPHAVGKLSVFVRGPFGFPETDGEPHGRDLAHPHVGRHIHNQHGGVTR